jgi:hypothetical protein
MLWWFTHLCPGALRLGFCLKIHGQADVAAAWQHQQPLPIFHTHDRLCARAHSGVCVCVCVCCVRVCVCVCVLYIYIIYIQYIYIIYIYNIYIYIIYIYIYIGKGSINPVIRALSMYFGAILRL